MDNSLKKYFTWILSFIFIAAGVLKMFSPDNTGDILIFLFHFSYSTTLILVYSIAIIETLLGVALFFNFKVKVTKPLVIFSCSLFLIVAVLGFLNDWQFACGCFGKFSFGKFDPAMVFRNSLLLLMALWITVDNSIFKKLIQTGSFINNNK
ncbi:MAG: hypothetical protein JJ958_03295 [Balneola sp.]|jgi:hypothetical protein|nr:hypothetical protein [Balneola sp.]